MANILRDPEGNILEQRVEPPINPGSTFTGWFPIKDPAAQLLIKDDELGVVCHYLNDMFPKIELAHDVTKLRMITLRVRAKNPATSGTMLVTPVVGGVDTEQHVVPVTGEWTEYKIPLDAVDTNVVLRRDLGGTIDDGGMTTVLVKLVLWEDIAQ